MNEPSGVDTDTPQSKRVKGIQKHRKNKKSLPDSAIKPKFDLIDTNKESPKAVTPTKKKNRILKKSGTNDADMDKILLLQPAPLLVAQIDQPIKKKMLKNRKRSKIKDEDQNIVSKQKSSKKIKFKPLDTEKKSKKKKRSIKKKKNSSKDILNLSETDIKAEFVDESKDDFLFDQAADKLRKTDSKSVSIKKKTKVNISDTSSVRVSRKTKHINDLNQSFLPNTSNPETRAAFNLITEGLTPIRTSQPIIRPEKPMPLQTILDDTIDESRNSFSKKKLKSKRLHKKLGSDKSSLITPVEGFIPFAIELIGEPDDNDIENMIAREFDITKLVREIKHQ